MNSCFFLALTRSFSKFSVLPHLLYFNARSRRRNYGFFIADRSAHKRLWKSRACEFIKIAVPIFCFLVYDFKELLQDFMVGSFILHVMNVLGHKRIDNTLKYTYLVDVEEDEYISRVAQTVTDACTLIDSGFEYVCDIGGNKIFRKRK